jgi:glycosyltransferase involved in cell wall biosynthesis
VKPLRVVMIGPFGLYPRMTMRVRALPLARHLVARGHIVTLLLPPWQHPEDAGRVWVDEGVRIENATLPRGIPGWFHARLTARLVRRTRALDPDVVHAFKPKAYAGLAHMALARRYPVVVDTDDWEGPGGWNDQGDYPGWMQRLFTRQERWGLTHASAVTVASRALETLAWSMGGPPQRVVYLPNGARPPQLTAPARSVSRPTMLLYTRFFEYDLDYLWRVVRAVRAALPEARLLVVGQGFHGEERRLMEKARQAGWRVMASAEDRAEPDLLYAGWGTEENLPWCFGAADVALYPFADTLLNRTKCPMKLMDLMASGIPVVADDVGQISEVVVPGQSGQLVSPGDAPAFARTVTSLLSEPDWLRQMGAAAREDVLDRFSWQRLARRAEEAYAYALDA